MGTSLIQPSFAAGELAPSLYARTDLAKYQTGLKLCSNFIVMPYGGIKNRPGTVFINSTKSDGVGRLIPFQFNDEQTYVLLFGHQYMRVYMDGGVVESSPGVPYEIATPYTAAQLFELNYTQSADVMTIVHPSHAPRELRRTGHTSWSLSTISFVPSIAAPTGLSGSARSGGTGATTTFRYKVTAVLDSEIPEESLPSSSGSVASWDDKPGADLSWSSVSGADYYNVYKDNNGSGIYGFIGRADSTSFTDNNIAPVKTDTPPTGNNPFSGSGNYPGAVGYYQQRLCFAGSNNNPQTVWMSKTGAFHNFGYSTPVKDDDSITFTIAAQKVNRIRHLLPLKQLLGLTTGGEWVFQGSAGEGVTPKTISADIESYNGTSKIPPLVINKSAIYQHSRSNSVASLSYSFEDDGFAGEDLTKFSPHFFRGYTVGDWAYQQVPDRLVWAVRSDGALLSMTFLPEEQLVAWHQHHTDGEVESVCAIAEDDEDALYLVVKRTIDGSTKRYVERMSTRRFEDMEDAYFVDCGLTYDGRNHEPSYRMAIMDGATWKYPEEVSLYSDHSAFPEGSVGRTYRVRSGIDSVRLEVTEYITSNLVKAKLLEICPESLRGVWSSDFALMATSLAGLDHLEGKTVSILTDGDVHPQQVVQDGSISLQYASAVVHVGLPYTAEVETLEINVVGNETLLDKRKAISGLTLFLESSRNFFAGSDADHLYEQKGDYREAYNGPVLRHTGTSELKISSSWSTNGRVYIQQPDPLPLTILAIIPDVTIGGKS